MLEPPTLSTIAYWIVAIAVALLLLAVVAGFMLFCVGWPVDLSNML